MVQVDDVTTFIFMHTGQEVGAHLAFTFDLDVTTWLKDELVVLWLDSPE